MWSLLRIAAVLGATLPAIAAAQDSDLVANPLKRANPGTLATSIFVSSECGLSEERALEAVNSLLIESQIRPMDLQGAGGLFHLSVGVQCVETAFFVRADFRDVFGGRVVRYDDGYATFGLFGGSTDYLLEAVKASTARALVAYLEANIADAAESAVTEPVPEASTRRNRRN